MRRSPRRGPFSVHCGDSARGARVRGHIFRGGSGRRSGSAMRCHRDHAVFDGVPEQIVRNVVEQACVMESASTRTASSRRFHLQRLAPCGPRHRPLAHWLFRVQRAPERRLPRVVCHGLPRHTPRWHRPERHWRFDQQRAPAGALAMLGVASSMTRLAPRMRCRSMVPASSLSLAFLYSSDRRR